MADENMNNEVELDWNSGISAEAKEANLPPVGAYGFTVVEFERTFSKSSGKPMATITLELDKEGQFWKVTDYLVLSANMEWKLIAFFESVGLKKKGEALAQMPWDKVLGASGRVFIKHETYEGKTRVKVDRYVVTDASQAPKAPAPSIPAPAVPDNEMPFEV